MIRHGLSESKIYAAWERMKDRCNNPNNKAYKHYGGRGIGICQAWQDDFIAYYNYVLSLPYAGESGRTIDRINNDGGYEPENVRWATKPMQMANRRNRSRAGYTGAVYDKRDKRYESRICINRKNISIGRFGTAIEAAKARDQYIIDNALWDYPLQVLTNR